jgi:hypothetical protein
VREEYRYEQGMASCCGFEVGQWVPKQVIRIVLNVRPSLLEKDRLTSLTQTLGRILTDGFSPRYWCILRWRVKSRRSQVDSGRLGSSIPSSRHSSIDRQQAIQGRAGWFSRRVSCDVTVLPSQIQSFVQINLASVRKHLVWTWRE